MNGDDDLLIELYLAGHGTDVQQEAAWACGDQPPNAPDDDTDPFLRGAADGAA